MLIPDRNRCGVCSARSIIAAMTPLEWKKRESSPAGPLISFQEIEPITFRIEVSIPFSVESNRTSDESSPAGGASSRLFA